MQNFLNTIPFYPIFVFILVGAFLHFFCKIINLYILPIQQKDNTEVNELWQKVQIVLWIIYALLFFTLLFTVNSRITLVVLVVVIGLGWKYWRNIFYGILIKYTNHLKVGDSIEMDYVSGKIQEIRMPFTKLLNKNGEIVVVPNTKLKLSVRKHKNKEKKIHIFTIRSKNKLNYERVYSLVINCPYITANQKISIEQIKENEFQIKASLIDASFLDKTTQYFD